MELRALFYKYIVAKTASDCYVDYFANANATSSTLLMPRDGSIGRNISPLVMSMVVLQTFILLCIKKNLKNL